MMEEFDEFAAQMHVEFIKWSMSLRKPTEPDCPSCHHKESQCVCGYIQFRTTMEFMDAMRGEQC